MSDILVLQCGSVFVTDQTFLRRTNVKGAVGLPLEHNICNTSVTSLHILQVLTFVNFFEQFIDLWIGPYSLFSDIFIGKEK